MALSKVAIANRALQKLGATRVESLTQDHPNARSMNVCFDQIRDALLRRYIWAFAKRRDSLAADGDQTVWGGHNRFSVPNDFIFLIRDDESGFRVDWDIESDDTGTKFIITDDAAPLDIKYVARVEDPNLYDPLFVDALASQLAVETCVEITGSAAKKDAAKADFDTAINEAMRIGAMEKPAQDEEEDDWISVRN